MAYLRLSRLVVYLECVEVAQLIDVVVIKGDYRLP